MRKTACTGPIEQHPSMVERERIAAAVSAWHRRVWLATSRSRASPASWAHRLAALRRVLRSAALLRCTLRPVPPQPLLTLEGGRPRSRAENKISTQTETAPPRISIFFSDGSLDLGP